MQNPERGAGFTLVEALVALLVLALAMGALQLRITSHLDNAVYLRTNTQAAWVAQNQLELLRLAMQLGEPPSLEGVWGTEQLAGSTWYWSVYPLSLPGLNSFSRLVPVQIGVSNLGLEAARNAPVYSLQTVMELDDVR